MDKIMYISNVSEIQITLLLTLKGNFFGYNTDFC